MSILGDLQAAIQAECPIDGLSADANTPKSEWVVWFKDEATEGQKAQAQFIIDNFSIEEYNQTEQINTIKAKAGKVITAEIPNWKQANMTARAVELLDKKLAGGTLTTKEKAEETAMKAAWSWVKEVRTLSDDMETALKNGEPVNIETGMVNYNGNWPKKT